jgi:hypothetical protein
MKTHSRIKNNPESIKEVETVPSPKINLHAQMALLVKSKNI